MIEGSYTAICEAYDKLYKRLPTRKVIRASAALPMLMGENEDGGAEGAEAVRQDGKFDRKGFEKSGQESMRIEKLRQADDLDAYKANPNVKFLGNPGQSAEQYKKHIATLAKWGWGRKEVLGDFPDYRDMDERRQIAQEISRRYDRGCSMEESKDRDSSVRICKRCGGRVLKDGKCDTCNSVVEPLVMESERERFSDSVRSNAERIFDFFRGNGVEIDPVPEIVVKFDSNDPFDPLIRTGCYDCDARTITLCCANRHLKDVLRTFCHELIHHNQNLLNPETFKRMNKEGKLRDNAELSDMEGDAYARGNVMFRKWTESL